MAQLWEILSPSRNRRKTPFDIFNPAAGPVAIIVTIAMKTANAAYQAVRNEIALINMLIADYASKSAWAIPGTPGGPFSQTFDYRMHEMMSQAIAGEFSSRDKSGNKDATNKATKTTTTQEGTSEETESNVPTVYIVGAEKYGIRGENDENRVRGQIQGAIGDGIEVDIQFVSEVPDEDALGMNDRFVVFLPDSDEIVIDALRKYKGGELQGFTNGNNYNRFRKSTKFKDKRIVVRSSQIGNDGLLEENGISMVITHELVHSWGANGVHASGAKNELMVERNSIKTFNAGGLKNKAYLGRVKEYLGQ
jgi:hypothetical protein